jgi:hypothetical protein
MGLIDLILTKLRLHFYRYKKQIFYHYILIFIIATYFNGAFVLSKQLNVFVETLIL